MCYFFSLFLTNFSAAAAMSLQSCLTLCDPIDGSPRGSPVPGILQARVLPRNNCCLVANTTPCDPRDGSSTRPWDTPGKNTGVGCHFLRQCMKVESESEVAQSCRILSDPMDCGPPGSSIHGIFQARVLEWGAIAFSAVYCRLTQKTCGQQCLVYSMGLAHVWG